jgi:hypothetical protein
MAIATVIQVQLAIDHNKRVFEARMKMEDTALIRKSFNAWRAARYGSVAKQQILLRACARIQVRCANMDMTAYSDMCVQTRILKLLLLSATLAVIYLLDRCYP